MPAIWNLLAAVVVWAKCLLGTALPATTGLFYLFFCLLLLFSGSAVVL